MADEEGTQDTIDEMCWVHELIAKYMKFFMTKKEIVYVLSHGPKIDPCLIEIVWQNLEENNKKFFRAYRARLVLKDQIERFNNLLEKQVTLMSRRNPVSASTPLTNGSWCHSDDNSLHQAAFLGPSENMDQTIPTTPILHSNGASCFQPAMQVSINTSNLGETTNELDNNVLVQGNTPETILCGNSGLPECSNAFMQRPNSRYNIDEPMNGLRVLENHCRSQFPDHTYEFHGHSNQRTIARYGKRQP